MCDCIRLQIADDNGSADLYLQTSGQINGTNYWTFEYNGTTLYISRIGSNPGDCFIVTDYVPGSGSGTIYTRHCPPVDICTKAVMSPNAPSNDPLNMWNFIADVFCLRDIVNVSEYHRTCTDVFKRDREA